MFANSSVSYDMYAGDSRGNSSAHPDTQGPGGQQPEAGQALEVVELANGETIWYDTLFSFCSPSFKYLSILTLGPL